MLQDVIDSGLDLHSIFVMRHGKVAWKDFRSPYGPRDPHVMFSVSKSITSLAVGFAVAEGRLALDDKVAELVPELRGKEGDPYLERLTIRHLLTMTSGKEVSYVTDKTKKQWLRDYADARWGYAPGEGWNYCDYNIYLLCAILTRVCGESESVTDFLMPRLFEPLGIARPFWENDGHGVEAGGWGLYLPTEDFAKIALCCTQGGVYEGRRVIPAEYLAQATAAQAQQNQEGDTHGNNGYGFCFWMNTVPDSFRFDGVFSQLGLCFPAYDACVVTTAGEIFSQDMLDALFRHLPSLFTDDSNETPDIPRLPAYPALEPAPRSRALEENLEGRTIHFPVGAQQVPKAMGFPVSVMPMTVFFMSADKAGNIDRVRLRFQEETLKFSWSEGLERNTVLCGMDGHARKCKITLGGIDFTVTCSAAWEGTKKLHIWIRPLNSVAERRLTFTFRGRQVRMLPRSEPTMDKMGVFAGPHAAQMAPNPLLGNFIISAMDKIALVLEPIHIGFLR